jgi:hypothetical protein
MSGAKPDDGYQAAILDALAIMEEIKDNVVKAGMKLWETLDRHSTGEATEMEVADVFMAFDEACASYAIVLCGTNGEIRDRVSA